MIREKWDEKTIITEMNQWQIEHDRKEFLGHMARKGLNAESLNDKMEDWQADKKNKAFLQPTNFPERL